MTIARQVARAARRVADQTTDRVADVPAERHFIATVSAVGPATGVGGQQLVYISRRGNSAVLAAGCSDQYTPVAGHRVKCVILDDGQLLVEYSIGRVPN